MSRLTTRAACTGLSVLVLSVLGTLVPAPGGVVAQSALGAGGFGLLSEGLDARARGLGVPGIGLGGWHLSPTDPAAAAGLALPSATATFQPSVSEGDGALEAGATRFPAVGASYPFGRHVISLQFGSFLDQEWSARVERTLDLSGQPVDAVDSFEATGGIGHVRLGWATRIGTSLAVGLTAGSYVGSLERRFSRSLDAAAVGPDVAPFETRGRWRTSGPLASAGVIWEPTSLLRLAASGEWSGDLELDPVTGTDAEFLEVPMPLTVRVGGTFAMTPAVALAAGVSRADWSDARAVLGPDDVRDVTWGYGAGAEWMAGTVRGRQIPLRFGYRQQELPFHFEGQPVEERSWSGGLGLHLVDSGEVPVARITISMERGSRDAGAMSEDYWRTTVSLRLAGG